MENSWSCTIYPLGSSKLLCNAMHMNPTWQKHLFTAKYLRVILMEEEELAWEQYLKHRHKPKANAMQGPCKHANRQSEDTAFFISVNPTTVTLPLIEFFSNNDALLRTYQPFWSSSSVLWSTFTVNIFPSFFCLFLVDTNSVECP